MKRDISVLVTDLDNTLFDWFDIWYTSFSAMLNEIVRISNIPIEVLEREIKTVHEKHGTSEYAFLIEELPSLAAKHQSQNVMEIYAPAIDGSFVLTCCRAALAIRVIDSTKLSSEGLEWKKFIPRSSHVIRQRYNSELARSHVNPMPCAAIRSAMVIEGLPTPRFHHQTRARDSYRRRYSPMGKECAMFETECSSDYSVYGVKVAARAGRVSG